MKIGIIGAGGIGQAFAKHMAKAGYEILLSNSRGPASLASVAEQLGVNVKAATLEEAAATEVIFLSLPWIKVEEVVKELSSIKHRIVIDATNPILPGFKKAELGEKTSSQVVAELLPGAKVVKAFNTLLRAVLAADPNESGGERVLFYSGDDVEAKKVVGEMIRKAGFAGIDLGDLITGGKLQSFPGGPLSTLNLLKLS
ncbi:NADPH-dependent F420 reductase [Cesiribacter sp. SM1]|uniref:NADPH-dependent F420 reductase n=1 Tax=Cesiribacter sp. SM1 TaxID=2861196 RepID=UPI001CD5F82A|nr:NAD(P)-binding domain-containing protein [Cesiribacter sp. SM1]